MTGQATSKSKRRCAREPKPHTGTETKTPAEKSSASRRETKIGKIMVLLQRGQGATLDEMVTATSCLPHTTRAVLTGLRKKGHTIDRDKRDNVTCYRIAKSA